MKKLMLLGAVVALAASALPGAAAAGRFTGVVVAKDSARHTIAVVIGKQVRTVRTARLGEPGRRPARERHGRAALGRHLQGHEASRRSAARSR